MQLPEYLIPDYHGEEDVFEAEIEQLKKTIQKEFRQNHAEGEQHVAPSTRGRRSS
jgi:hypothetical protein